MSDFIQSSQVVNANEIPTDDPNAIIYGQDQEKKEEVPASVDAIPDVLQLLLDVEEFLKFKDRPENLDMAKNCYGMAINKMYEKFPTIPYKIINIFMDPEMPKSEKNKHFGIFVHMIKKLNDVKAGKLDINEEDTHFTDKMYSEGGVYDAFGGKDRYMRLRSGEETMGPKKSGPRRRRQRGKVYKKPKQSSKNVTAVKNSDPSK